MDTNKEHPQTRDEIVNEGPGFTISRSSTQSGLVPYLPDVRADGNVNHGWIDLRGCPDRVALIPEAVDSPGLTSMLRSVADTHSSLMSGACDCAAFNPASGNPKWGVGGFITIMYQDGNLNADANTLITLARQILNRIRVDTKHWIAFEFIVEPMKLFFGRSDCYALFVKPLGYGYDEISARLAFEEAARATAVALAAVVQLALARLKEV